MTALWTLREVMDGHPNSDEGISHAALLLAAEFGAVNHVKAHVTIAKVAEWTSSRCNCLPLLYHAAVQPLLLSVMSTIPSPVIARTFISLLLSSGADPNCRMSAAQLSAQQSPSTTPWRSWLKYRVWADPEAGYYYGLKMHEIADVTGMFLAAGADPAGDVPCWILPYLSDQRNWDRLVTPGVELLRAVEILRAKAPRLPPTPSNSSTAKTPGSRKRTRSITPDDIGDNSPRRHRYFLKDLLLNVSPFSLYTSSVTPVLILHLACT
jgi:hypothetical protein